MNNIKNKMEEFLIKEFLQFSITASWQVRNEDYPIYDSNNFNNNDAKRLRKDIKLLLLEYFNNYNQLTEKIHISNIIKLSDTISEKHERVLFQGRFRIGIAQKVINLFFKYMWTCGLVKMPFHFPVDNIIKTKIRKRFKEVDFEDWTELDNIKDYKKYFKYANKLAISDKLSLAEWELKNWKRK